MKTRDRILETALELFNAERFGNVTTADLAEACGISEGNLWYHFKNKRALLEALTDAFLEEVEPRLAMLPGDPDRILEDYADMLIALMSEIRRFRFLYRDQTDYGEHTIRLLQRLPSIYRGTQDQFRTFLLGMIKAEHLRLDPKRTPDLAMSIVIILRYHLEYLRESGHDSTIGSGAVQSAIEQHLTLFDTALTGSAYHALKSALQRDRISASTAQ